MNKNGDYNCDCTKLSPFPFAMAGGIILGLGTFILGLLAMNSTIGDPWIVLIASIYKGYAATVAGSFIGGLWGFAEGFVTGLLFAWLYNGCLCCKLCRSFGMCQPGDYKDKSSR